MLVWCVKHVTVTGAVLVVPGRDAVSVWGAARHGDDTGPHFHTPLTLYSSARFTSRHPHIPLTLHSSA